MTFTKIILRFHYQPLTEKGKALCFYRNDAFARAGALS
jgi:hypothetical protein